MSILPFNSMSTGTNIYIAVVDDDESFDVL
jgi:hypothetical protein